MKAAEIKQKTDEEIRIEVEAARKEIFGLRCKFHTSQQINSSRIRTRRKDIARLLTEETARQRAAK